MLDYEWENQSSFIYPTDQTTQQTDQNNDQFLDPQAHFPGITNYPQHQPQQQQQQIHNQQFPQLFHATPNNAQFSSMYDPRAYGVSYTQTHETSMLSLQPTGSAGGFMVVPKTEPQFGGGIHDFSGISSRIGLNLGGRTYFASSSEDDFVNRLYRGTRGVETGSVNSPKCQAEGCNADLTHAKHYHRRHKVCEFHSKAATVIAAGLTQRFCQQCSRFHVLSEFDNGKRSCRKRLADHNRRRRKNIHQENNKKQPQPSKSSGESGAHSSTVTVSISPPRISVDCFRQRTYHGQQAETTTSSANFFSNG